ncbi:MAG: T9SS type A sorting domain-containing protein, partial [Bacteroidales bacterium]|nr:T9SS type A sorting domain-containing protein [Bacteroidales bacterium]
NPFSSDVTIVLEHFRNEPATIEIYDVMGKAIKYVKVESTYNEYETTLNLEELPAGIYTVRVSTSSATLNRQITKR